MTIYGLLILAIFTSFCFGEQQLPTNYVEFETRLQQCEASLSFNDRDCPQTSYQFPNREQTTSFLRIKRPIPDLDEFTLCGWFTMYTTGINAWISYSTNQFSNAFLLEITDNRLLITFNNVYSEVAVNVVADTEYHVCIATFASSTGSSYVFINGRMMHILHNAVPSVIEGGGVFIIGQDQDFVGGGFNDRQSVQGKLSNFMLWNRILDFGEVDDMYNDRCHCPGDFMISLEKEEVQQYGAAAAIMPPACPE